MDAYFLTVWVGGRRSRNRMGDLSGAAIWPLEFSAHSSVETHNLSNSLEPLVNLERRFGLERCYMTETLKPPTFARTIDAERFRFGLWMAATFADTLMRSSRTLDSTKDIHTFPTTSSGSIKRRSMMNARSSSITCLSSTT